MTQEVVLVSHAKVADSTRSEEVRRGRYQRKQLQAQ